MTAMSLFGNCRTESDSTAASPAIRNTRLTTITMTGRMTNMAVSFISAVLRLRRRLVGRRDFVVDQHRGPGTELEHSRRDHFLAGIEAGEDRHLVAARGAELHH